MKKAIALALALGVAAAVAASAVAKTVELSTLILAPASGRSRTLS